MRFFGTSAIVLAWLALAACTSTGSSVEAVLAQTSAETTSSIARSQAGPVPPAAVGAPVREEEQPETVLAMAPATPMPDALVPTVKTAGMPVPAALPSLASPRHATKPPVRSKVYSQRFRDAKPIDFGSTTPHRHAVHGVDVSRWQGEIDWGTLRAQGANFVYIKATDGGDHLDPMFKKNWREAHEAGLKRGAYHFFYWCRVASEQADWFIRNVPKVEGALPPVLDVEWNGESRCRKRPSRKEVLAKMRVFLDRLEKHYGQRPIIYTAPDFYRDNLSGELLDYPFWLRSVAAHPSKVYPGRDWVFWQYSGTGLSQGVKGKIDLNVFHGDENTWHRWLDQVTSPTRVATAGRTQ